MNPIFLIVGPPAVGKSTISRALAARFPLSVHIPVDTIRDMVVSGLLLPTTEWSDPLARQVRLARKSAAQMAMNYHAAGYAVVIDDFWDANHPTDYQELLDHPALQKIILYPEQEEAHRRNFNRTGGSPSRAYIDQGIIDVYQRMKGSTGQLAGEGWRFVDTTRLNVEETVAVVLDG